MTELPTVEQIQQLPSLYGATVGPEHIDANGHMNVRHYFEFDCMAVDRLVTRTGVDEVYRRERRLGVFTAEHHLRYFSELRAGDRLTVHPRVLDVAPKTVHMIVHLLDVCRRRLANTLELVLVHVDLDRRRAVPMPPEIHGAFAGRWREDAALGWSSPVCGAMGLRRR